MKVSQIGLISKKLTDLDLQFPVQDMLFQTGQIHQFSGGIYAYGHIPFLLKNNIKNVICSILTKHGCSEISLPLLQPENIWQESGRLDKYINDGVMFRVQTDKSNFCLAPTAEEAVVEFAKKRLSSYKNLPVTYFQIGEKFRNEIRTRGFLLRGKSFEMMDAYSFGRNNEDLEKEYNNIKQAYLEIFDVLGLNAIPVGADSGSIGGTKSEEFMCISEFGEDNILFDENTKKAFNSELLERKDAKKYLKDTYGILNLDSLKQTKAVELGHIFQLGDKYAKSMNGEYIDEFDKPQNYIMGCYGIGVSRTVAMVYENSLINKNNFEGISLPINLAPYILYIIPKYDDEEKLNLCISMYEKLTKLGIPVLFDDRQYLSIGAKIKDSKITGTPYVAIFGKTLDENIIEVENNKTGQKQQIKVDDFEEIFTKLNNLKSNKISLEDIINN